MFHPPRPEMFEPGRAEGTPPLPPAPPPPNDPSVIPPEPGAPQVSDVVLCVGQFYNIDFGGYVDTHTPLPEGLVFQDNQFLYGTPLDSFCGDVILNEGSPNERRFRLVAIDAQTFTPRLTPEISPGYTFSEAEGNYQEACGIVTFSARFKRKYIRNYSLNIPSDFNLLWQGDLFLNVGETDAGRYILERYQLPTLTSRIITKDASFTPVDIHDVITTQDMHRSTLTLAPESGGVQFIYYCTGNYPDLKLRRFNLTTGNIDASYVKDIDYYRGNSNLPTTPVTTFLLPHALAINNNRIYVFLSAIGNYSSSVDQNEWYKYDYNWRTYVNSIVQSYSLDGTLQTAECQENLRIQGAENLPFVLEFPFIQFSPAYWKSRRPVESLESAAKIPAVFATDNKIYMVISQGFWVRGHNYIILTEFDLNNNRLPSQTSKALLIDGIDDNFQGLHQAANGDFYIGLVTDDTGGFSVLGGQETRGLIKVHNQTLSQAAVFEVEDQAIDYVDMEPPKGNVISNCIGTVGNARGQGNLSIQTFVQNVNNKIRISYPVDYADEAEIFVTGQYKVDG